MAKSLIERAFDYVSKCKGEVSFKELWEQVSQEAGLTEEEKVAKVSQFYTNLMLDGRFVTLGNNFWDLRERNPFDKVHIDMKDVYDDTESEPSDDEEEEEEEYKEPKEEDSSDEEKSFEDEEVL